MFCWPVAQLFTSITNQRISTWTFTEKEKNIKFWSILWAMISIIFIWLIWLTKHVFGRHIYVMVAQCGSLLGIAENLTHLVRARICKISRQKCCICKFLQQKCHFFKYQIPKNTRLFWNYFGSGSGIAKNHRVGSGIGFGYPSDTASCNAFTFLDGVCTLGCIKNTTGGQSNDLS